MCGALITPGGALISPGLLLHWGTQYTGPVTSLGHSLHRACYFTGALISPGQKLHWGGHLKPSAKMRARPGCNKERRHLFFTSFGFIVVINVGHNQCMYSAFTVIFGKKITKYTVLYGVYIHFWPTLCNLFTLTW